MRSCSPWPAVRSSRRELVILASPLASPPHFYLEPEALANWQSPELLAEAV